LLISEYRQPEGRLGDEHVAGNGLERCAGWIRHVLVIPGGDDPHPVPFDTDLCRAEDVAGRPEGHRYAVDAQCLAVRRGLRAARVVLAMAQSHEFQRLSGRQHGTVTCACVIRMPVGDESARDRPERINVESPGRAAQALRCRTEQILGAHDR
jgi:hypothetical protein